MKIAFLKEATAGHLENYIINLCRFLVFQGLCTATKSYNSGKNSG